MVRSCAAVSPVITGGGTQYQRPVDNPVIQLVDSARAANPAHFSMIVVDW
jgi:hypothetical protein